MSLLDADYYCASCGGGEPSTNLSCDLLLAFSAMQLSDDGYCFSLAELRALARFFATLLAFMSTASAERMSELGRTELPSYLGGLAPSWYLRRRPVIVAATVEAGGGELRRGSVLCR